MEKLYEFGTRMGLEGDELMTFIREQQAIEREERSLEREREKEKFDREREKFDREREKFDREREKERLEFERDREREKHELAMKQIELEMMNSNNSHNSTSTKDVPCPSTSATPKLPAFVDHKDDLDSYLNRFERFARSNKWEKTVWATSLSALLTGRALDVYSRLPETSASDYDTLKEALLKRYELTENGFRNRFKTSKPEHGESPEQFFIRLGNYLTRWIELSGINKDYDSLCDLLIKDQFISSCPTDLAIHLKERAPSDLHELSKISEQYLMAHGKSFSSKLSDSNRSSFRYNKTNEHQLKSSTANFYSSNISGKFQPKCAFCFSPHKSEDCRKINSMDKKSRKEKLKQSKACFVCLKIGKHVAKECHSGKCQQCGGKHNVLICEQSESRMDDTNATTSASLMSVQSPKVLLMTASVYVKGTDNKARQTRLLIDGGSQRSYIRTSLSESLKANVSHREHLQIQSFGEKSSSCDMDLVNVQITSKERNFSTTFKLLSSSQLCSPLETVPYGPWVAEMEQKGYILADEVQTLPHDKKPIDIIIGADQMWKIMTSNVFSTSCGVVAWETKLGWVLQGPISCTANQFVSNTTNALFTVDISKFWDLETIGISNDDDYHSLKNFNASIQREEDGRYKVPLLWKDGDKELDSNFDKAKYRLKCLEDRLEKNPKLKMNYNEVFEEYRELGIIEKVPDCELNNDRVFYLPHHAVVKESSTSTKVRPVFDGSCTDKNGTSLNDILDPGPSLLPQLVDLLLRFRQYVIPYTADITKAFLQLSLKEEERNFVRFLWNNDIYRFTRVCFGITCAPFLLNATIRYHLTNSSQAVSDKMIKSFYVDDLIMGSSARENCVTEIKDAIEIMKSACMALTKWTTSSLQLAERLKQELKIEAQHTGTTKVLGLPWNLDTDEFELPIAALNSETMHFTKRAVLSYVSQIFDPLGFAAPIVTSFKIFLKVLWTKGYDWDEVLPPEETESFKKLTQSFAQLQKISIPRSYQINNEQLLHALHLFCDASEQAYAACVYIQFSSPDGNLTSSFVISKTRLAPVKRVTLPRLELLACFLGVKLLKKVTEAQQIPEVKIFCWTDSTIALGWIRSPANRFKQFVSNRIQAIQSMSSPSSWSHCPGTDNPADQATRKTSFLIWNKELWFNGPTWLNDVSKWPEHSVSQEEIHDPEVLQETKKETAVLMTNTHDVSESVFDVSRFSSLKKAVRIWWQVKKAVRLFKYLLIRRNGKRKSEIDTMEKESSHIGFEKLLTGLIQMEQKRFFHEEINCLKKGEKIPKGSSLYNSHLSIQSGLLVSIGRIDFDQLIILPHKSHLTKLIILDAHLSLQHGGISTVLTDLRSRYWITRGRRTVRSAIRMCQVCRRHDVQPYMQQEAPLSAYRLHRRKPFETTGLDYAGPFYPTEGSKVYLMIFTCTVIRAVHLEMCLDLTIEEFMLAFRRFRARYGDPKIMISDNFKTFQSAQRLLADTLEWRFTPGYSPSWGGLWERLIRSVKNALKRILGRRKVKREVLRTIFHEIESSINKRPLTYCSDDRDEPLPIRPIDFFEGTDVCELKPDTLRQKIREKKNYLEKIWERWKTEYLMELRSWNRKKCGGKFMPKEGDIVIVNPKTVNVTNRALWPLGQIVKLFPGRDGFPRCVMVKSQGQILRRNTSQLYPLEV